MQSKRVPIRSLLALVFVVALAGSVAACGGGNSSDPSPPQNLTKTSFTKEANAICAAAQQERKEISKGLEPDTGTDTSDQAKSVMETLVAPVTSMVDRVEELGSPRGEAKQVASVVEAFRQGVEKLESAPESPKLAWAFATADKKAAAYGLTDCMI
jgi:type IV pilus biogenesis protein CpaD/CtpE